MLAASLLVVTPVLLWLALGAVLALVCVRLGRRLRRQRARVVWASGLVLVTLVYVGFAAVRGDGAAVVAEALGALAFGAMALRGLRGHPGWLAAGWLLHPLWDLGLHPPLAAPTWYVWLCLSFDTVVGIALLRDAVRR